MTIPIDWSSLASAIVGGAIAGYFSLRAVDKTYKNESKKRDAEEEGLIRAYLNSIRDEIETLWHRYMWGVGKTVESLPEKTALLFYYPLTQNYFTVYENNANLIGKVKDDALRKLLITTYTKAKGLVDSFRLNNELVQKHENLDILFQQTKNPIFQQQMQAHLRGLVEYASGIKESHAELGKDIEELLKKL